VQALYNLGALALRAVYLLGLAIAPPLLSPAPEAQGASAGGASFAGVVAVLLLAAVLFAAGRLRVRLRGPDGLAAASLIGASVAAALVAGDLFHGEHGPLGRGVVYVAVPLWAGFAVTAGAVAARRYGSGGRLRRPGVVAGALVAAVAVALFALSKTRLDSSEHMWLAELRHDGDDADAAEALTRAALRARKYDAALALLDRCPGACACLAQRAQIALRTRSPQAVIEATAALERCPTSSSARATAAEALALFGDAEQAEQAARAGLEKSDDGRLHYALSLALDSEGRHGEAVEEAKRAVKLGAGRDAALLVGSQAILTGDLDAAVEALQPVVAADPDDADAQYDLALVADRRHDYNRARQGYLAALRGDPRHASARYNLTLLTLGQGALDEARHHAQRFAASFPDDPRGAYLVQRVAGVAAATAAAAASTNR
jgi:tetratricopeptide (TPR) repeat protein